MFEVLLSQQKRIFRQSKYLIRLQPLIFLPHNIYWCHIYKYKHRYEIKTYFFHDDSLKVDTQGYVVKSKHEHNALYSPFVSRMNRASLTAISHRAALLAFF